MPRGEPDALRGAGPCTNPGFALPFPTALCSALGLPSLLVFYTVGGKQKANTNQAKKPTLTKAAWFLLCSSRHGNPQPKGKLQNGYHQEPQRGQPPPPMSEALPRIPSGALGDPTPRGAHPIWEPCPPWWQ